MERSLSLSGNEICKIIKTAGECGVKTLKVGEVELEFKELGDSTPKMDYSLPTGSHNDESKPVVIEDETPLEINDDLKTYEEDQLLESEFENLVLEDPEEYERLLALGKIDEFGSPTTRV